MSITRRDLIRTGAAAFAACLAPRAFAEHHGEGKRILIIGGGPAGLCAGYELVRAGCEVLIFEGSQLAGGRIRTLREPFANGLYAEAGATIMYSNVVEEYVDEFGLATAPIDFGQIFNTPYLIDGKLVIQTNDDTDWPESLDLNSDEQGKNANALVRRYRRRPIGELKVRAMALAARERQRARQAATGASCNAELPKAALQVVARPPWDGRRLLQQAVDRKGLTGRGLDRVLRLARTLADLAERDQVLSRDVTEALLFRAGEPGSGGEALP